MNIEAYYGERDNLTRLEARLDDAWDSLPDSCKRCNHLTSFNNCDLYNLSQDGECPLSSLTCEQCEHSCKIIKRDGEEYDFYMFCDYEEELVERDYTACKEFILLKGE